MANDNDLIERYLYAITRRLPAKQRADVAEELRTLISDMLDERCRGLPPTAKDVRVVLTELGTPGEMVRKYTADEDACLIGQPYYAQYLYVLKIVLACVAGGMIVAGVLTLATGAEERARQRARRDRLPCRGARVRLRDRHLAVRLLLASWRGRGGDGLARRPAARAARDEEPHARRRGGRHRVLHRGRHRVPAVPRRAERASHRGDGVPFDPFNAEAIRSSAWVIIAWTVVCIGAESFKLVEGRYTPRLLAVTLVSDLVVAGLAVFWLTSFQLVDTPAIVQALAAPGDALSGPVLWAVSNAQVAFCGFIVLALAIDAVDSIVKTVKANR
ncbi:MAG: hypothetical protein V8S24_07870 [Gordonibacter pamelaeae]